MTIPPTALTIGYNGISPQITTSVLVSTPKALLSSGQAAAKDNCLAIWDTGATGSAITELTAKKLNLIPHSIRQVSGLGGTVTKSLYLIDIVLPNNVQILDLPVTEIDNPTDANGNKVDSFGVLIGMDIITMGDFSVTNFEGKTVMTFRMPSQHKLDYVKKINSVNDVIEAHRKAGLKATSKCICGSGKNFRNCHGKGITIK
jgi:hypothetical protein